jgi:hypothetical protein
VKRQRVLGLHFRCEIARRCVGRHDPSSLTLMLIGHWPNREAVAGCGGRHNREVSVASEN